MVFSKKVVIYSLMICAVVILDNAKACAQIYLNENEPFSTACSDPMFGSDNQTQLGFCGPDITQWLVDEMNANVATDFVQKLFETRHSPDARIRLQRLSDWAERVGPGQPWDHKPMILNMLTEGWESGDCPALDCFKTITLCGMCFDFDVPSNIHYGYVGRQAGFRKSMLALGPLFVQSGSTWLEMLVGEAKDTPIIRVGFGLYLEILLQKLFDQDAYEPPGILTSSMLCKAVSLRHHILKKEFVRDGCVPCEDSGWPDDNVNNER